MLASSFKVFVIAPRGHWLTRRVVEQPINKHIKRKRWGRKCCGRTGSQKKLAIWFFSVPLDWRTNLLAMGSKK